VRAHLPPTSPFTMTRGTLSFVALTTLLVVLLLPQIASFPLRGAASFRTSSFQTLQFSSTTASQHGSPLTDGRAQASLLGTMTEADTVPSSAARRDILRATIFSTAASVALLPKTAAAEDGNPEDASPSSSPLLRGTVSLQPGTADETGPTSALYVTARPDRPDNVPRAILDGTRGKPPPVLAGRFPNPEFPFEFALSAADLTPEGAARTDLPGAEKLWWEGLDLVVSARLDSDGVAATRDPSDLVGRSFYAWGRDEPVVQLQGRGVAGKFFTEKGKK